MEAKEKKDNHVSAPLIGAIKEKGFSPSKRISAPRPTATPFPVARHRSEGPYWAPLPLQEFHEPLLTAEGDADIVEGARFAIDAQPLQRREKRSIDFTKWKQTSMADRAESISSRDAMHEPSTNRQINPPTSTKKTSDLLPLSMSAAKMTQNAALPESIELLDRDTVLEMAADTRREVSPISSSGAGHIGFHTNILDFREEIDAENQATLHSMSEGEIFEAQRELTERLRPDILTMLKKRGKDKGNNSENLSHEQHLASSRESMGKATAYTTGENQNRITENMQARRMPVSSADGVDLKSGEHFHFEKTWSNRVEAIRTMRFGLDGHAILEDSTYRRLKSGNPEELFPNAYERDFLRCEGNPAAAGYTIKEALELTRSMVPAQRSAGLRLLAKVLSNCVSGLQQHHIGDSNLLDWPAVWAYALGPEAELVLTFRVALDDSHATVVATCARAIECLLSSPQNERYFNLCEEGMGQLFTAPIFRKSLFKEGKVGGSYWKYNVKPSDMFPFSTNNSLSSEEERTVKDDAYIANQDVAAGLIRMGILPRIRYILEVENIVAAEESLFNVLIALTRHSPAAADAVMNCPRLMDTVLKHLQAVESMDFDSWLAQPKAIQLLKVLSLANKGFCNELFEKGLFQASQLGLFHQGIVLGQREKTYGGRLEEGLLEAIRFWRVCVNYQLGIDFFATLYPALLFWISPPGKILEAKSIDSYSLAKESFCLLEALASTLQVVHVGTETKHEMEMHEVDTLNWSWNHAVPLVETSVVWLSPGLVNLIFQKPFDMSSPQELGKCNLLGIITHVLHFLATTCEKIMDDRGSEPPWLPAFVPDLTLQLIKSGLLGFFARFHNETNTSLVERFFQLKANAQDEALMEIFTCLHGLLRLLKVLDNLLKAAREHRKGFSHEKNNESVMIEEILSRGLAISVEAELQKILQFVGDFIVKQSHILHLVDSKRGGPAPGVGVGWGCVDGGYWSVHTAIGRAAIALFSQLVQVVGIPHNMPEKPLKDMPLDVWHVKVALHASVIAGPADTFHIKQILSLLFQPRFISMYIKEADTFVTKWLKKVAEQEYLQTRTEWLINLISRVEDIGNGLQLHYENTWLRRKHKSSMADKESKHQTKTKASALPSINEAFEPKAREMVTEEWVGRRLPLLSYWFLSPFLCEVGILDKSQKCGLLDLENITFCLLFLCAVEALMECFPCLHVHIHQAVKIHALSSIFLINDEFFLETTVRSMIGALQESYCHMIDYNMGMSGDGAMPTANFMNWESCQSPFNFETVVDERYPSFVERLSNQFASVSYGDIVFGRQVALYLRRDVSKELRMRVWKVLESEHALGLLPTLEQCCGHFSVYLFPHEDNMEMLEIYAASWRTGALDRAKSRNAVSFVLAGFHISACLFGRKKEDGSGVRAFACNFLVGLTGKSHFQDSLHKLVMCNIYAHQMESVFEPPSLIEVGSRCRFLEEICSNCPAILRGISHLKQQLDMKD